MNILYYMPSLNSITFNRPNYFGYKNAFIDMGHNFRPLTAEDHQEKVFAEFKPEIFFTSISQYYLKFLNLDLLKKYKKKGLKIFVHTPFWKSPMSKLRINEVPSLSKNKDWVNLIKSGNYGDVYYNICEQDDPRMTGFTKTTGYPCHTVLLAADKTQCAEKFSETYSADISFIGTYLPEKRDFMKKYLFPLAKKYKLKLYCQDLTLLDRSLNFILKVGQYFNIPLLKSFKKNNVTFKEERQIFRSSTICVNIHENYQKKFGRDFNDRTFKIPLYGGFEVTDEVKSMHKYFKNGVDIVIAKNGDEWLEKIDYYLKYPEKRLPIIKAGQQNILSHHTYHHRVKQFLDIYNKIV